MARGAARRAQPSEAGQATIEHIGVLAVVAVVVLAVVVAFTASSSGISRSTAELVCRVLTLGQGSCGGSGGAVQGGPASREPDDPCVVRGDGDTVSVGGGATFVAGSAERGLLVEQSSDGTYEVMQSEGGRLAATTGVGGSVRLTVDDVEYGGGAGAGIEGGVTFSGGQAWSGLTADEVEGIRSAESWERVERATATSVVGSVVGAARNIFGVGPQFPPPDRIFVEGGLYASGNAYAGADGAVGAGASVSGSQVLGYSHAFGDESEHTLYFRTTVDGEAAATVTGVADAGVSGTVELLTSVTVRDGELLEVSRTGIAAGEAGAATGMVFGDAETRPQASAAGGTQYTATLEIDDAQDARVALSMLASSGITPASIGMPPAAALAADDPLGLGYVQRVMDQGDLTRVGVQREEATPFALDIAVEMGPVAGLNGGYSTSDTTYTAPEYYDGTGFAARTTC